MIETRITIAIKVEIKDTETNEKKGKNPLPYTLIIKEGKTGTSGLEYNKIPKEEKRKRMHQLLDMLIEQIEEE